MAEAPPTNACFRATAAASLPEDVEAVTRLLGRRPQGAFAVVARHEDGSPVVIRNEPRLDDGTPMPTRYWLVGEPERTLVSRLESRGGVGRVEAEIGLEAIAAAHERYAAERDAALAADDDDDAAAAGDSGGARPRPSGGVGGTRTGVKCLHAHYAWHLAGGDDPVGRWVAAHLAAGEGARHPERQEPTDDR
ncbi:MAG: hypothetical protein JWN46_789 [Acidimicrobiales bacterium]|nr:hypothetical protein [Acidimicrobiales bacterium]